MHSTAIDASVKNMFLFIFMVFNLFYMQEIKVLRLLCVCEERKLMGLLDFILYKRNYNFRVQIEREGGREGEKGFGKGFADVGYNECMSDVRNAS